MKKGTKKPLATAARGRGVPRGTTSFYRPLASAASMGIQQYPASVTGGPGSALLAPGGSVPRTARERKFQAAEPGPSHLPGTLRLALSALYAVSVCAFVGLHYTPLFPFVKRDFLCLQAGVPSFAPKTLPLKDPASRRRLGKKGPFLLTFGKKFAMIL